MSTRHIKKETGIPQGVISRLPVYYRYLSELVNKDIQSVSSSQLGEALQITAAQIRSDLSYFGSFGQQGYGYRVDELFKQVSNILGLNCEYNMVLIGAGNLGRAIASYPNFAKRGFQIKAIFDIDPLLEGSYLNGCIIQPVNKLAEYLQNNKVDIGVLTTPPEESQQLCDQLVENGIKGIWNFSPIRLSVPQGVVVEHIHLTDSLMRLSFKLYEKKQQKNS